MSGPDLRNRIEGLLNTPEPHGEPLRAQIRGASDGFFAILARDVDESPYSLEEWVEAHLAFARWEQENSRTLTVEQKQEYLNCCIAGTKASAPMGSLIDILMHFIEAYGVTG